MLNAAIAAHTASKGKTQHQLAGVVGCSPFIWLHSRLLATDVGERVAAVTIQVVFFLCFVMFSWSWLLSFSSTYEKLQLAAVSSSSLTCYFGRQLKQCGLRGAALRQGGTWSITRERFSLPLWTSQTFGFQMIGFFVTHTKLFHIFLLSSPPPLPSCCFRRFRIC